MSEHNTEEMLKHIKVYILVFLALAVLTVATVWAAYIHVSPVMHITIALAIASVKGGLVMAYFMHLINERKLIHFILIITAVFFIVLLLITSLTDATMGPLVPDMTV